MKRDEATDVVAEAKEAEARAEESPLDTQNPLSLDMGRFSVG